MFSLILKMFRVHVQKCFLSPCPAWRERNIVHRAVVPLRRPASSLNNCFMQMWQVERAVSQSEAPSNRGRSKFRGTKFGGKKEPPLCSFFFFSTSSVYCVWRAELGAGTDWNLQHRTGSNSALPRIRPDYNLETELSQIRSELRYSGRIVYLFIYLASSHK